MGHPKTYIHGQGPGIGDFCLAIADAGISGLWKAIDNPGWAAEAANIAQVAGVPQHVIMRWTEPGGIPDGQREWYMQKPDDAAAEYWERMMGMWAAAPELHPHKGDIWLEIGNELETQVKPDNPHWGGIHPVEWLGRWGQGIATRAINGGFKALAFGMNSGTPEKDDWALPGMEAFLRLCAAHPSHLGISLHEGYGLARFEDFDSIEDAHWIDAETGAKVYVYPHVTGRFAYLTDLAAFLDITPPTIALTEWAWSYDHMPGHERALQDADFIGRVMNEFPNVLGSCFWNIDPQSSGGPVAQQMADFRPKLQAFIKATEYPDPDPPPDPPGPIPPNDLIPQTIHLLPQDTALSELSAVVGHLHPTRSGFTYSADLAHRVAYEAAAGSHVVIWDGERWQDDIYGWFDNRGITWVARSIGSITEPAPPPPLPAEGEMLPGLVESLSQRDPAWANVVLGVVNADHTGETIGSWGCLLVTYNMMARYWGLTDRLPPAENNHYKAMGCFSGPFIKPAALNMAYPGMVAYGGYMPRSDSRMVPKIREWIDAGRPVAARVDHNPTTIQFNQHWVMLIGYDDAGFIMADPWHGDTAPVRNRYAIAGEDVLEGIFYWLQSPAPPQSDPALGLHAAADVGPRMNEADFALFRDAKVEAIKVLDAHAPEDIGRLRAENPQASLWVVRAFLDWGGRNVTPAQFVEWTLSNVLRSVAAIGGAETWVELANEVNLNAEGLGLSWADGTQFAEWIVPVVDAYRGALPNNCRLMYPGLSPGGDVPGIRQGHQQFFQESLGILNILDGAGVHCYWQTEAGMTSEGLAVVDWYRSQTTKPIIVTEASNKAIAPDDVKAAQYIDFCSQLRTRAGILGVTYYVASASNPAFAEEVWVGTGIAQLVGQR